MALKFAFLLTLAWIGPTIGRHHLVRSYPTRRRTDVRAAGKRMGVAIGAAAVGGPQVLFPAP